MCYLRLQQWLPTYQVISLNVGEVLLPFGYQVALARVGFKFFTKRNGGQKVNPNQKMNQIVFWQVNHFS